MHIHCLGQAFTDDDLRIATRLLAGTQRMAFEDFQKRAFDPELTRLDALANKHCGFAVVADQAGKFQFGQYSVNPLIAEQCLAVLRVVFKPELQRGFFLTAEIIVMREDDVPLLRAAISRSES